MRGSLSIFCTHNIAHRTKCKRDAALLWHHQMQGKFEQIAPLQNWIICWKNERICDAHNTCTLWFTFNKLRSVYYLRVVCCAYQFIYYWGERKINIYTVWAPPPGTLIWTDPNTRQLFNYICLRERIKMFICIDRRMYKRTNKIRYLI